MRQSFISTRLSNVVLAAAGLAVLLTTGGCLHRRSVGRAPVEVAPQPARPAVRRTAPDFVTVGPMQRAIPSKQYRGQPVVILIAPTADSGALRKEADRIEKLYLGFSGRRTIFVSAFTSVPGRVPSDVPFILAQDGPGIARAFGVAGSEFAVIVIGVDGNVDMVSTRVEAAQRILDVINNNGSIQAANRVGLGS